jgi:NitT/TauT family transport system substrate-binding protein
MRTFMRKKILIPIFLFMTLILPAKTLKLAIGYIPHIQFTPLYVGIEKGFYQEKGIDLKIEYGFGIDIFSLLETGKIDLGLSDSDALMIAKEKGMGLKAIFQYYQKYPVTIVAKEGKINAPADFKNKQIGTPQLAGTSYIGLLIFLKEFGLQDKVDIKKIGYTQVPTLISDKMDGVVCFMNNEPIQFKKDGVKIKQWDVKDFSDIVGASFITHQKLIKKKENILKAFIRATEKAMEYTVNHIDESFKISLKYIGDVKEENYPFHKEVFMETCKLFYSKSGYGIMNEENYQKSIHILFENGLIKEEYPASDILYSVP